MNIKTMLPTKPINYKEKKWGYEIWIHNSNNYCGKILVIYADKISSLHYHKLKDETFYIQKGKIFVKTIDKYNNISEFEMKEGDVLEIPKGLKHQFKGIDKKSEIIEISTQHFDNDSIQIKGKNQSE